MEREEPRAGTLAPEVFSDPSRFVDVLELSPPGSELAAADAAGDFALTCKRASETYRSVLDAIEAGGTFHAGLRERLRAEGAETLLMTRVAGRPLLAAQALNQEDTDSTLIALMQRYWTLTLLARCIVVQSAPLPPEERRLLAAILDRSDIDAFESGG